MLNVLDSNAESESGKVVIAGGGVGPRSWQMISDKRIYFSEHLDTLEFPAALIGIEAKLPRTVGDCDPGHQNYCVQRFDRVILTYRVAAALFDTVRGSGVPTIPIHPSAGPSLKGTGLAKGQQSGSPGDTIPSKPVGPPRSVARVWHVS